ncbi:MAG TPA: peptidylprolyl isomerase [Phycisphaerales bacterium]|nr:peptidylprolyl isomerase [Phycisphaerales bacterium]
MKPTLPVRALILASLLAAPAFAQQTPATPAPEAKPAPTPAQAADETVRVELETSMGKIVLELNRTKAPISTENFVAYASKGHYNGTVFHRVIDGFMVQGGGFDKSMQQKPTDAPIRNECKNGLKNVRGSVAMARTAVLDSGTSQFYINVVDNPFLDTNCYAVFGKVVEGMDVVDKIKGVKTTRRNGMSDVPVEPVEIIAARVVDSAAAEKKAEGEPKKDQTAPESKPAEPAANPK